MNGNLDVMMDSIEAVQCEHIFAYRGWRLNQQKIHWHMKFFRGFVNERAKNVPNYYFETI